MLKKSASIVLTSLRGSTYRSVRLASSLAAALLDELLSILPRYTPVTSYVQSNEIPACQKVFLQLMEYRWPVKYYGKC
jgi:hypothetical protein